MRSFSALEPKCVVSAWLVIKSHSAGALQWLMEATLWVLHIPILLHWTSIQISQLTHVPWDGTKSPHLWIWVRKRRCHRGWWEISLCQVASPLGCTVCPTAGTLENLKPKWFDAGIGNGPETTALSNSSSFSVLFGLRQHHAVKLRWKNSAL